MTKTFSGASETGPACSHLFEPHVVSVPATVPLVSNHLHRIPVTRVLRRSYSAGSERILSEREQINDQWQNNIHDTVPVKANIKRTRSQVSTAEDFIVSKRRSVDTSTALPVYGKSHAHVAERNPIEQRGSEVNAVSKADLPLAKPPIKSLQRCTSRGRYRMRHKTISQNDEDLNARDCHSSTFIHETHKGGEHRRGRTIRDFIPEGRDPVGAETRYETAEKEGQKEESTHYMTKGRFLLQKHPEVKKFKHPLKASSQGKSFHCAGDGFSGDESKPDFIFTLTGKPKRKRSRSLPGLGRLTLEPRAPWFKGTERPSNQCLENHSSKVSHNRFRSAKKNEEWPTTDNFNSAIVNPYTQALFQPRQPLTEVPPVCQQNNQRGTSGQPKPSSRKPKGDPLEFQTRQRDESPVRTMGRTITEQMKEIRVFRSDSYGNSDSEAAASNEGDNDFEDDESYRSSGGWDWTPMSPVVCLHSDGSQPDESLTEEAESNAAAGAHGEDI